MATEEYRCSRCGAPLEVSPETIMAICEYCGFPNIISGTLDLKRVYIVPSLRREDAVKAFHKLIERDFDLRRLKRDISIVDLEGYYIPVWLGEAKVSGEVEYYRYEERNIGGESTRVKARYKERIDRVIKVPIIGRRQIGGLGIDELVKKFVCEENVASRRLADVEEDEWMRMRLKILNTEIDETDAISRMREDAVDIVREQYLEKAEGIEYFSCTTKELRNVGLFLVPIWWVYYKYKGSIYQAVFSGWDMSCIARTEPLTFLRRLLLVGVATGVIVLMSILNGPLLQMAKEINVLGWLALCGFLLSVAYKASREALEDIRIEREVR
ncbi:MAG: hypothetical protein DRN15_06725 [Thermoprotei archaeon]|nr:MAG: hypothetical protein DRN15_06725 [Thermoprotei archaeon]RLF25560.1 MAG: hypothetical protein DRM97_01380 [Thermoprotei archaeon]